MSTLEVDKTLTLQPDEIQTKVLVLGTGIAGLSTAIKFARNNTPVILVAKTEAAEGSTRYAQGGIASVWSKEDSFEQHKQDTLTAGAGLCHDDVVEICVQEGPSRVRELISLGVEFTKRAGGFDLHREGGHGKRRILHADDLTGWAIERALLDQVHSDPRIRVLEHHVAVDLITEAKVTRQGKQGQPGRCLGAYLLNSKTGRVISISSEITVLATGGAGKVYLYTSNPDVSTGDGIAMAHRAGARIANMEFMQFHPTCLYHPSAKTFLISEALRGEGAILKTVAGKDFMPQHHPLGSLAPRDVVARAIDIEMKRSADKHVLLDCSAIGTDKLIEHFPHIFKNCLDRGIDITKQPIPVVPAAHYICGGVQTDLHGETSIPGLYGVGEVACTGLHGANRLASNSLLEAVVFAHRVAEHGTWVLAQRAADTQKHVAQQLRVPHWDTGHAVALEEQIDIAANWLEIRHLMWNYVGIVRSNSRLERAKARLQLLRQEVNHYYWDYLLTRDLIELRNLLTVAELIVSCSTQRKESRGLHYTADYPAQDPDFLHDTVV